MTPKNDPKIIPKPKIIIFILISPSDIIAKERGNYEQTCNWRIIIQT